MPHQASANLTANPPGGAGALPFRREPQCRRDALACKFHMLIGQSGGPIRIMSLKRSDDRFVLPRKSNGLLYVPKPERRDAPDARIG